MIYRLLALNIDGTLLQPNGRLHKSTKDAIEYVQQKGIYVTLVTSRSFLSAKKVARALKLDNLLVTHSGGFIASEIEEPTYVKRFSENLTIELVKFLEKFPCQIRLVHEEFSVANKYKLSHRLLSRTVFTSGDPMIYQQQFVDSVSKHLEANPVSPPKIEVYFEQEQDLVDAEKAIYSMYGDVGVEKHNSLRCDILPSGVSKLTGLMSLGDQLGFSLREMVVIGDSLDDIDMLKAAGLGVAMWNAPVPVKKASDWVTRSNTQHGVAFLVKEHFRKQQPIEFLKKMNIIKN